MEVGRKELITLQMKMAGISEHQTLFVLQTKMKITSARIKSLC